VQICTTGRRVLVPLAFVINTCDQCMKAEGIDPSHYSVGDCYSVGGLFSRLRKGASKSKVVPKFARKALKGKIARGLTRTADKVGNTARDVATHPAFRAGVAGLAVAFPALAPAAVGLEVAAQTIKRVDKGVQAAKQIEKGVKTAANIKAVKDGAKARRAIQKTVDRAKSGDSRAQRAAGAVIGAKVAQRAAKRRTIRRLPPKQRPRLKGLKGGVARVAPQQAPPQWAAQQAPQWGPPPGQWPQQGWSPPPPPQGWRPPWA
jgi:hypothetical protein